MGQIFSKCFDSSDPSGMAVQPSAPPPGAITSPIPTVIPPNPATAPPAGTDVSQNPAATTLPNPASSPPVGLSPPGQRDFWKEAIQKLPKEYKLPEEWKAIDQEAVNKTVNDGMEKCKDQQWKVTIKGEERTVRELFEKTVGWLQAIAPLGGAAAQAHPMAGVAWTGFCALLQVAVNDITTYGAMVAGLERATWLTSYCSAQERLYKEYFSNNSKYSDLNDAFVENLVQLYIAVLRFFIQAYKYFGTNTAARSAKSIVQPSTWVTELIEAIGKRKGRMEDYASLVHKSNMHEDLKDVLGRLEPFSEYMNEGRKERQEKEREDFMNWLSGIKYTDDHNGHRETVLKNPNKSGQWMLTADEFCTWKTKGGLLWLHGIPGAGKSKLTSTVIDHLMSSEENHTVAYFYCLKDTKQPEKGDPKEIFRAILKQLIIQLPNYLSDPVKKQYDKRREQQKDHGSIAPLTLGECADFIKQLAMSRPITIVIDALDECREDTSELEGRTELFHPVMSMINSPNKIKIFLSSRKGYHDIDHRLGGYANISMDDPRNTEDIPYFIEYEVKKLVEDKASLWKNDQRLEEDIIQALKEKAGGMFRWVVLQIDYLREPTLPRTVRRRLKQLPEKLSDLHDEIYERISKMGESELDIAKATLSWLLCAQRRLSSSELLAAVSTNADESVTAEQVVQICRNFVVLGASDSFEFAHLSVREYLETRSEYKDGQPDVLVAKKCLDLFESDTLTGTLGPYASIYWLHHSSGSQMETALAGVVEKLFLHQGKNKTFEEWAETADEAARSLDLADDKYKRLRDARGNPLSVVCVFGFPKVLAQWVNTQPPEYSFFRDADEMVVHLAIKWGNEDVVRLLLQKNARGAIDKLGLTPAFWAALFGRQPVLEVLKQFDGCLDTKDDQGWTAWNWMVAIGDVEGLENLLNVETGINMTDQYGWTILHWAAYLGYESQVERLIKAEHKLDAKDNDNRTPFELAEFMGHRGAAGLLRIGETSTSSSLRFSDEKMKLREEAFFRFKRSFRRRTDRLVAFEFEDFAEFFEEAVFFEVAEFRFFFEVVVFEFIEARRNLLRFRDDVLEEYAKAKAAAAAASASTSATISSAT